MSGKSLNQVWFQVYEAAEELTRKKYTPLQRALGKHLEKVSNALYVLEKVLSDDYAEGADEDAIIDVLKPVKPEDSEFKWTQEKVIDFVNWYIELHELGFNYTLENEDIIKSFQRGDSPDAWKKKEGD